MSKKLKNDGEVNNPCLKEQNQTYKCLNDNNFDKEVCSNAMLNYKSCKAFWSAVQSERRKNGTRPLLPPVGEREKIKDEYFKSHTHE